MSDSPYDLVRATDPVTGAHVTISRAAAEAAGATVLKGDAVDRFGTPLPTKQRITKNGEPAKAAATSEKKENG